MAKNYEIRRMTVDTVNWTPVISPMDCNRVLINRGSENDNFRVRTDPANGQTEMEVAAGLDHDVATNPGNFTPVFPTGTTICWIQAKTQAGSAVARFLR